MAVEFKACTTNGCNRDASSSSGGRRGWCSMHYQRFMKASDGEERYSKRYRCREKWLEKHKSYRGKECISWPFSTNGTGRGTIKFRGVQTSAPRAMCTLAHGYPPTDMHQAAHSCGGGGNGCLNPRHLRWATPTENEADKVIHGTLRKGTDINTSKLSESDVREIRKRIGHQTGVSIARQYGITPAMVSNIKLRISWAWLD